MRFRLAMNNMVNRDKEARDRSYAGCYWVVGFHGIGGVSRRMNKGRIRWDWDDVKALDA